MNIFNTLKSRFSSRSKCLSFYPMEGNMLVLSRKLTESIEIGDSVVVTVLKIRGNNVRIGIDAPKEILVRRSELRDQVSDPSGNGSRATVAPTESYDHGGTEALKTEGGPSG